MRPNVLFVCIRSYYGRPRSVSLFADPRQVLGWAKQEVECASDDRDEAHDVYLCTVGSDEAWETLDEYGEFVYDLEMRGLWGDAMHKGVRANEELSRLWDRFEARIEKRPICGGGAKGPFRVCTGCDYVSTRKECDCEEGEVLSVHVNETRDVT